MTDTPPLIQLTLDCIAAEDPRFNHSFDLVDELIALYGEQDLAEKLYREIDEETDCMVVANLFSILNWSTEKTYSTGHNSQDTFIRVVAYSTSVLHWPNVFSLVAIAIRQPHIFRENLMQFSSLNRALICN